MSRSWQTIRRLAIAANRVPVVGRINRIPYHLAVRSVTALCARYPEVASLHVTGSFARNDWTPGLSDIDFSVLIRTGLDPQAEFKALQDLWREYRRRVRWFPMLGELEILPEDHAETFSRHGFTGHEMRHWRRLYGSHLPFAPATVPVERLRTERLRHVLRFYRYHFPRQSRRGTAETWLRLNRKIHRALDAPETALSRDANAAAFMAPSLAAITSYRPGAPATSATAQPVRLLQTDINQVERRPLPPAMAGVAADVIGVAAGPWDLDHPYVLLVDDLPLARVQDVMTAAASAFDEPIVLTLRAFTGFVHLVDPFLYFNLLRTRVVWGEADPIPQVEAPSRNLVEAAVWRSASDTYIYPFTESLEPLTPEAFRDLYLGWILRMLRYLEDGVIDLDFPTLEAYFAGTGRPCSSLPQSAEKRFALCRRAAVDIERLVSAAQSM